MYDIFSINRPVFFDIFFMVQDPRPGDFFDIFQHIARTHSLTALHISRLDPNFSQARTRKMRISRVARVAERYISLAKTKQI